MNRDLLPEMSCWQLRKLADQASNQMHAFEELGFARSWNDLWSSQTRTLGGGSCLIDGARPDQPQR
jgi:hypothetical protein